MAIERIYLKGRTEQLKPLIQQLIAFNLLLEDKDIGEIYGIPATDFHQQRKFHPQIILNFLQPKEQVLAGRRQVEGRISFRLMGKTSVNITNQNLQYYGERIKLAFGGATPFDWHKGKDMYSYADWEKGYQLQLLCKNETEARRLITAVLSVQGHSPSWKLLTKNTAIIPEVKYDDTPGKTVILGNSVDNPHLRPVVTSRFTYAELHLHGLVKPIILHSISHRKKGLVI